MRAGVGEVFALEPDGGAAGRGGGRGELSADVGRQAVGAVKGRRAADEAGLQFLEVAPEDRVTAHGVVHLTQLNERGDQGFGDVGAAEDAEAAASVGNGGQRRR